MGLVGGDDPGSPPLWGAAASPRRRRALRKLAILTLAAVLAGVAPGDASGVAGTLRRRLREATTVAVRTIGGLSWPGLREPLRAGLHECRYDWRLRCLPIPGRPTREARPAGPRATEPVPQGGSAADRERDRRAALALERSPWIRLQPLLRWPGALAHATRLAVADGGWPAGLALTLVLVLGATGVMLVPLPGWSFLLLPATALVAAWVLDGALELAGRILDWPGQLFLLADTGITGWRLLVESRRRVENGPRLWPWRRRRAAPPAASS